MDRRGQDAIAVDVVPYLDVQIKEGFEPIPMWVADMNFPTCPAIIDAVQKRLDQHHFGYFQFPPKYFESIINWQRDRNDLDIQKDWIGYENGVLGGVASALESFTLPGEPVLVHSPTYIGFDHVFKDTGRVPVYSPLKLEGETWVMDYEDMDKKIRENKIHTVIFNTPHNPTGRVWTREETEKAYEIFQKHNCLVISDEIWSDIILDGHKHIPPLSISEDARERTIALYAPSKTFSLAGLVGSYHVIPNETIRNSMDRAAEKTHYNSPNVLSMHALMGGFSKEGAQWVDELCEVISKNEELMQDFFRHTVKGVKFGKPEGTYMLYLDFTDWLKDHPGMTLDDLYHKGLEYGILWQDGRPFMMDNTIRMNLAVPTSMIEDAIGRLNKHIFDE